MGNLLSEERFHTNGKLIIPGVCIDIVVPLRPNTFDNHLLIVLTCFR